MNSRYVTALFFLLVATSAAWAEDQRKASVIVYQIPRTGQVSLAVYDQQGRQVRTLLAGESQAAGEHTLGWDGLDRLGNPLPVGDYTWKLLMNNGLEADYVFKGRVVHDCIGLHDASFEVFMMPPDPRWLPAGGRIAGAMEFAEPGIQVQLPGSKVYGDFTMTLWVRTKQANAPLVLASFDLWLEDGRPRLDFGGWPLDLPCGPRLNDGQWHHLAFAWDQSGGKRAMFLYVDGVEAGTSVGPGEAGIDRIGLGLSNSYRPKTDRPGFIGAFDDVRVFGRRISAAEIATLAHRGSDAIHSH